MHLLHRRMDHFERARREEEAPLLDAAFAEKVRARTRLDGQGCSVRISTNKRRHRGST